MKIWHAPKSRSLRVLWLCEEMGVPYEVRRVSLRRPDDGLLEVNPFGSVPVLEDEGGVRMIESVAMLLYVAGRYGPTPLALQPADPDYPRYVQWLVAGEASLGMPGNMLMYDRYRAPEDEKGGFIATACLGKVEAAMGLMVEALRQGPWIAGDRFTIADISAGYGLGVLQAFLGLGDRIPPEVADYYARLSARPAFQRADAV
ncbi:MAG TPA: glutathione S-transferase family protein [Caulobacteraceae bacterium]|jgi:glutathione S-transferase